MFVEGRHYDRIKTDSEYQMIQEYVHVKWLGKRPPIMDKNGTGDGVGGVGFHTSGEERVLTLHSGYMWNGSDYVPDRSECMRASAIHDAWCRAMKSGDFQNTGKNWNRGAREYAAICRADGLHRFRVWARRATIVGYGIVKYFLRKLF